MSARILVVDDIEANVRLLEAKLSAEYYDVLTASAARACPAPTTAQSTAATIEIVRTIRPPQPQEYEQRWNSSAGFIQPPRYSGANGKVRISWDNRREKGRIPSGIGLGSGGLVPGP